ncbi:flagellar hook-associated protein FlgL [Desulfonatronovibrio magnus]|uniref:flagellar hook-associated protein FlgL n=1 Tax=Desulfonatronovibrio magnus TaxID=698827 RepID=UPI0005EB56EB|nr:flagellar hook-associated protein FlgL [Desulfonatronovibrio magnus]
MRVSQSMLFNNFVTNMNKSSYQLMQLNMQASSQKRVNKPSDDAIGMSRILSYRDSIKALEQYKSNIDTAKGWLGLADETLMQANNVLIRSKEIAEQASTGTLNADQREILSYEARQLMDQMVNLSNTRYEGKSIFGGHKVDGPAFEHAMTLSSNQDLPVNFSVTGKSTGTIVVQFLDDGDIPPVNLGDEIDYRYSADGGKTWNTGRLNVGDSQIDLNGITVGFPSGHTVQANDPNDTNDTSGTWLWVRPTAKYNGDDEDENITSLYAQDISNADVSVSGVFDKDVTIRIDDTNTGTPNEVEYSYSLDGGSSWNTGNTTLIDTTTERVRFLVPGGRLEINNIDPADPTKNSLNPNDQILIRPHRAAINFEISANESLQVNSIGKDVFGGIYKKPGDNFYSPGIEGPGNVFETMGELIGYLETNNQDGISRALENLDESLKNVNNQLASIGARENRLNISESVLSGLVLNEKERMSKVEDVDVAELMTKLANQQIVYEAVLRSSSNIMRMNLVNHI